VWGVKRMSQKLRIDTKVKLNNGIEMPVFGLGTYQTRSGEETRKAVRYALKIGYRHIDTAAMYGNEKDVGEAIRESSVPRQEVFVTTKLWNSDHGYEEALKAFEVSRKKLRLDFVDLYLIHWPVEGLRKDSWRALEKLQKDGKCRAIGVSNYMTWHIDELLEGSSTVPAINQVEFSPYLYLKELLEYCRSHNILLESYSPLTKGYKLKDPKLAKIADKYSKTPAQILIRWTLQKDVVVIPKSSKKERIKENAEVFDFAISDEDMQLLDSFDEDLHTSWNPSTAP
jgi:diketogulonate reductase-like aldo/keto reductase